jgi:hypothetical protein
MTATITYTDSRTLRGRTARNLGQGKRCGVAVGGRQTRGGEVRAPCASSMGLGCFPRYALRDGFC